MTHYLNHIFFASFIVVSMCLGVTQVKIERSLGAFLSITSVKDSQDYNLKGFNKVNIGKGFMVEISRSDQYHVSIVGDKNDIERYAPFVQNNTLQLKYIGKDEDYKSKVDLKIKIHLPSLNSINLNGKTESLINGFSNVDSLDIIVSGSSVATIAGEVKNAWVQVSGKSNLFANELTTNRSVVNISFHSYCELTVKDSLFGNVSSGANLVYKGNAKEMVILSNGKVSHRHK